MNQENVAEEAAAQRPAARSGEALYSGGVGKSRSKIVAFKFGGSSLLGAERMFHAARLVREAAEVSRVAVVVSAMKGVTDHLLPGSRSALLFRLAVSFKEGFHPVDWE